MSDFVDKTYQIFFSDGRKEEVLEYRIIDSPISRIWLDCVNYHFQSPDYTIYRNQSIKYFLTATKVKSLWTEIYNAIDFINNNLPSTFIDIHFYSTENEFLNYLHRKFHELYDNIDNVIIHNYLELLNKNIHLIQQSYQQQNLYATFFLTSTKPYQDHLHTINDSNLYRYFNYQDIEFGDLVLGYHTIGKNLWDCFKENDLNVVRNGLVRPQKTISSEVILNFYKDLKVIDTISSRQERMKQWLESNNLMEFVDISLPENNIVRQPLLGRLIGNYTFNDINEIFSLGKISRVNMK